MLCCALFLVPGFDHRLHRSVVPAPVVFAADALLLLGLRLVFRVFQVNSYTAGTIQVEANQTEGRASF